MLGTPNLVLIGIAVTTIWWTIGFNFVLYLAGLQDIPREVYEAAAVDGASEWQQIRSISIPLLRRTTTVVVLLQIIASLKIFDQVYLMSAGGPGTSSQVVLTLVADTAFTNYRVGAGSAASVLLLIVILAVTIVRPARRTRPAAEGGLSMSSQLRDRRHPTAETTEPRRKHRSGVSAAAPPPRVERTARSGRTFTVVSWVVLVVFALLWLAPSLWAIKTSLTANADHLARRRPGAGRTGA